MHGPSPPVRVIQVAIASFDSDQVVQWDLIFAAAVIASLPIVLLFAFLQRYGLTQEVKVNIEVNHATLAGLDFEHEIAAAFDGDRA